MTQRSITLLALILATGTGLMAQDPHLGIALNISLPMGDFHNRSIPPTSSVLSTQNEGYDPGIGAQFTMSFPIEQGLAFRLNLNGQVEDGSNTAAGYDSINLQHSIFSLGADLQIFVNGSASRHRGTYLIGGISADFERFDRSFGDLNSEHNHEEVATERKSRMGGNIGLGHSFGFAGSRFTIEASFHKTLSGNDQAKFEPPSSDFARLSFGWVF